MIGPFLFLDIDGVLNKHIPHPNGYSGCNYESVLIVNEILDQTQAKIVLVSAWRYWVLRGEMNIAGINGVMATHGLNTGAIVAVLPPDIPDGLGGADRGLAVTNWFRDHYGISHKSSYAIIDDLDLGYRKHGHGPRFYQTDSKVGLVDRSIIHMICDIMKK